MMMMMMMMTKGGQYMKLTTDLHLGARLCLHSSISCHGMALYSLQPSDAMWRHTSHLSLICKSFGQ
jgi:hypothetical protein